MRYHNREKSLEILDGEGVMTQTKLSLKEVRKDDILYFRCGGKAKIFSVEPSEKYPDSIFVRYGREQGYGAHYNFNGQMRAEYKTPFDIIKVRKCKKGTKR